MGADDTVNKKFEKAKDLFDNGLIKEFKDLFDVVPYTVVAKKINTNHARFKAKLENPISLKLYELKQIADILNIDAVALFTIVLQENSVKEAAV